MIKVNVKIVTAHPTGGVTVTKAQLVDFTIEQALKHLNHERGPMDSVRLTDTDDIVIEVAGEQPWTWTIHTFIAVP